MKDTSVAPVFLFDPARQRRLIDGFVGRVADSRSEHRRLLSDQSAQHDDLEHQLAAQLAEVKRSCHQDRQSSLRQWDDEQEKAITAYETASIQTRDRLLRTRIKYRKASAEQTAVIQGKYDKRLIAIEHQYKQRKLQPKKQQAAEFQLLDETLNAGNADLEWSRALTVRRLDGLLDVALPRDPYGEFNETEPASVREAVDLIGRQNRRLHAVTVDMQSGFASKVVDSFYLPVAVALFILIGAAIMLAAQPQPLIWWLLGLVALAGTLGILCYAILLFPLRKMTRSLHPLAERIRDTAEAAADHARRISKGHADDAAEQLRDQRKAHLSEANRWKRDQIADMQKKLDIAQRAEQTKLQAQVDRIDAQFRSGFATLQRTMRERADSLATTITQTLHQSNEAADLTLARTQQQHRHTLASLSARLESGLRRGMDRIDAATDLVQCRFPSWEHVVTSPADTRHSIDFLPLGQLRLGQRLQAKLDTALDYTRGGEEPKEADLLSKIKIPDTMPLVIHRRCHCGVLIEMPPQQLDDGIAIAHQVLWRLLSKAAPGRAKVTLIDANSRGQHFASFMALADHDPSLIHHRVWTTGDKITQRLAELTHHVEDVLQASLRDRFERIEDYNAAAGSLAEPYHGIAAVGFPEGLSRESYMHLQSLIQSGMRCGVFVILVIEQGKTWPADMPPIQSDKLLRLEYRDGHWYCKAEGIDDLEFWPAPPPPAEARESLIRRIGKDFARGGPLPPNCRPPR